MNAEVVNLAAAQAALRDHFLGWQCRLRQRAVRQHDGRPGPGLRPAVFLPVPGETDPLAQITTLLIKNEPEDATAQWRFMVRKTFDPALRREAALKFFAAAYYQHPNTFSDRLTALFGPDSALAARLLTAGHCRLDFAQYSQHYRIPCQVRRLTEQESPYQATFWHNSLFNPYLPGEVQVLQFCPDWIHAVANPEPAATQQTQVFNK